jgi:lipopolysaccharide transport system permease protein
MTIDGSRSAGAPGTHHVAVYTPQDRWPLAREVQTFWRHRELLRVFARRDISVRYKQSALGVSWAILQPLLLTTIFTVVFTILLHVKTQGAYPVFSYVAMLPWTFFANSLTFGTNSLISNSNLLTKVYFPREVLPIASVAACFFDFVMGIVVLTGMLAFYHVAPTAWVFLALLVLAVQILFTASICLVFSAVMVFFRDLRFVVPLLVQVWFYASPVIYPMSAVPAPFQDVYALNPMAGIVDSYRQTVLYASPPNWSALSIALAVSLVTLLAGYRFFKWAEMQFADVV